LTTIGSYFLLRAQKRGDTIEEFESQDEQKTEKQAEIMNDAVAKVVGRELKYAYKSVAEGKDPSAARADLKKALMNLLCE
jgi:hypothetical protein